MLYLISITIIFASFIVVIITYMNKKNKEQRDTDGTDAKQDPALVEFCATKTVEGPLGLYKVSFDEKNEKVAYISTDGTRVFSYDDILSVELLESGETISKKSAIRTVGGAIVGGIIAGGAGTIVGGLSGNSREKHTVSSVVIKVSLRNLSNPSVNIVCFENFKYPPTSDDPGLSLFYAAAQEIVDTFSVILDKVNSKAEKACTPTAPTETSLADEISKLYNMLQDGVITESEFSSLKEKLIDKK